MQLPKLPSKTRVCGPCTACCTTCAVQELGKPGNQSCLHLAAEGRGCSIYESRPVSCREFNCAWIRGLLPDKYRPDQSRIVWSLDRRIGTKLVLQAMLLDSDVPMERIEYLLGILGKSLPGDIIVQIIPAGMTCPLDWTLHFHEVRRGIFLADRESTEQEVKVMEDAGFRVRPTLE